MGNEVDSRSRLTQFQGYENCDKWYQPVLCFTSARVDSYEGGGQGNGIYIYTKEGNSISVFLDSYENESTPVRLIR
jgi:hypothetical protein